MKIISLFLLCTFMVSCIDNRREDNGGMDKQIDYANIRFPDTVYKQLMTEGIIDYNFEEYNLLKNSIGSGKVSRFIHFYPCLEKNKIVNEESFIIKDTFYTQNINRIVFNVKFDSIGIYYLNGIIKDMVILDTIADVKNKTSKLPAKFSYVLVNKKVVVIDKE